MKKFNNPLDPDDLNIRAAIKQWTIDFLKLDATAEIEIIEHLCAEASCLHAETVIKIQNTEGSSDVGRVVETQNSKPKTQNIENTEGSLFFKIAKPLTFIRKLDVQNMKAIATANMVHRH